MAWFTDKFKWYQWYDYIRLKLNLSFEFDQKATDILSNLLSKNHGFIETLYDLGKNYSKAIVVGAGPSLEESHSILKQIKNCLIVSANGATSFLLKSRIIPNIIVTDLDGLLKDIIKANRNGSMIIVHAHGDNIEKLLKYVPMLKNPLGSTQVEPRPYVYNFGGFTDGDRGVFIVKALGLRVVGMIGMDLGQRIGKYSKYGVKIDRRVKIAKLEIAAKLLEWAASEIELYTLTPIAINIPKIRKISVQEFLKL
ncbi:MAG: 6-hydroxymethylpterin diphosphokinase MptE-like protein [Candidatus Methanomethylicia archaeon]